MAKPSLLYYRILDWRPDNVSLADKGFDVVELDDPDADTDTILAAVDLCCAPLGYQFDDAKMGRCANLRAVISNTTGVSHIDTDAAKKRGIEVLSLFGERPFLDQITPTSEHAWGLLIALARRMPWCFEAVKKGHWNRFDWGSPSMLSRLSLGIVGFGRLGQQVARYGQAFGMAVRFYDPYVDGQGTGIERVETLEDLAAASDIVSLHPTLNAETTHMIGSGIIALLKPGSYLVNTARGEVVDESAVISALESGHLGGYAADVLAGEFDPAFDAGAHPLVQYATQSEKVLLTPHIGGSTFDAWYETERRVIEKALEFLGRRR